MYDALCKVKSVFTEPRSGKNGLFEETLASYRQAVSTGGALFICVFRGKLRFFLIHTVKVLISVMTLLAVFPC